MHSLFLTEKSVPLQSMATKTMCSVIGLSALTNELHIQDRQFSHRELAVPYTYRYWYCIEQIGILLHQRYSVPLKNFLVMDDSYIYYISITIITYIILLLIERTTYYGYI